MTKRYLFTPWSDVDLAVWDVPDDKFYAAVGAVTGLDTDFKVDLVDVKARGVRGKNTKEEIVEILVFKRPARFFSFSADGDDFRNKEQINELEICIAVRI